jgi:hypothetical protein
MKAAARIKNRGPTRSEAEPQLRTFGEQPQKQLEKADGEHG